jgi:hypothetical protein
MDCMDRDTIRQLLAEQRAAQGLTPQIADPAALRYLAALVSDASQATRTSTASRVRATRGAA